MSDDRMTFEETCRELGVSEAELEQLVAAGEIASIKDGDTMYFKSDVVTKYKESKEDDSILLSDDEISLLEDDLEEIDLLASETGEDSAPTTPIADRPVEAEAGAETEISLEGGDDLSFAEDDLVAEGVETTADISGGDDETLLNLDGLLEEEAETTTPIADAGDDLLGDDLSDDTLLDTELDFGEETDTFDVDTVDDLTADLSDEGTFLRGGGARVMQMKRKESNLWTTVVLALCAVVLLLPLAVTTNTIYFSSVEPEAESMSGADVGTDYSWVRDYNFLGGVVCGIADLLKSR